MNNSILSNQTKRLLGKGMKSLEKDLRKYSRKAKRKDKIIVFAGYVVNSINSHSINRKIDRAIEDAFDDLF